MSTHRPHIPDWKTVKLGEVTEIIKGGTPSRNVEKYFRGDIAWAIPSDITALDSFLYIDDTETHITEEALSNSAARLLPAGTVLLTSRATIGETAIATVPMATNQGFANFICCEALLNVFLAYYLRYIKEKLNDLASGSTFKEITKGTLLNIEIPHLPLSEQRAIAEALSDVDGLLNALEALIAKKRAIKQATMQQLLTGKTRLPGFSGKWKTKRLGEIVSFFKGSGLSKTDLSPDGKRRCIHYGELFTTYKERISEVLHGTNRDGTFFLSLCNDVLMPGSDVTPNGLATASCISMPNVILGGDILVIRVPADILNGTFLAYAIKINHNQVMQLVSGTTVYHLYGRDMANFSFLAPGIEEQQAIVSVLSDMDAEIAALEQRRDKTLAIKQGMMQQLLTGRVRLSESRIIADDTD